MHRYGKLPASIMGYPLPTPEEREQQQLFAPALIRPETEIERELATRILQLRKQHLDAESFAYWSGCVHGFLFGLGAMATIIGVALLLLAL